MITNSHVPDTLIFEAGKLNIQVNDGSCAKGNTKGKNTEGYQYRLLVLWHYKTRQPMDELTGQSPYLISASPHIFPKMLPIHPLFRESQ